MLAEIAINYRVVLNVIHYENLFFRDFIVVSVYNHVYIVPHSECGAHIRLERFLALGKTEVVVHVFSQVAWWLHVLPHLHEDCVALSLLQVFNHSYTLHTHSCMLYCFVLHQIDENFTFQVFSVLL